MSTTPQVSKDACGSSQITFWHGTQWIFTKHTVSSNKEKPETSGGLGTTTNTEKLEERSGLPSVTDVKNLQVTKVELQAHDMSEKVLALCDSASSYSWYSAYLVKRLNISDKFSDKLTVHMINSNQVVDIRMVELKLTPVHSSGSCCRLNVKQYVREDISVGTDFIDVDILDSYAYVEMILGQDLFRSTSPLE